MTTTAPKFELGRVVATPGLLNQLGPHSVELPDLLDRHMRGDWGDVDAEDKRTNDASVESGSRLLSSYVLHGVKVWIITDAASDACPACWAGIGTCEPGKGEWGHGIHFRRDLPPQRLSTTILRPEDY